MSVQQLALASVRLLAIYFAVQALYAVTTLMAVIVQFTSSGMLRPDDAVANAVYLIAAILSFCVDVATPIVIWLLGPRLAGWVAGMSWGEAGDTEKAATDSGTATERDTYTAHLLRVGCVLLGIWYLTLGLRWSLTWVGVHSTVALFNGGSWLNMLFSQANISSLWYALLYLLVGIALFIRPTTWMRWRDNLKHRLRGEPKPTEPLATPELTEDPQQRWTIDDADTDAENDH